mmetsp:Transcript_3230/g.8714  ORF Transcript_3230/g.8714 Transcript_3230/m.8714 type:complete len:392 (+) Transcript_3230:191-1366(+)
MELELLQGLLLLLLFHQVTETRRNARGLDFRRSRAAGGHRCLRVVVSDAICRHETGPRGLSHPPRLFERESVDSGGGSGRHGRGHRDRDRRDPGGGGPDDARGADLRVPPGGRPLERTRSGPASSDLRGGPHADASTVARRLRHVERSGDRHQPAHHDEPHDQRVGVPVGGRHRRRPVGAGPTRRAEHLSRLPEGRHVQAQRHTPASVRGRRRQRRHRLRRRQRGGSAVPGERLGRRRSGPAAGLEGPGTDQRALAPAEHTGGIGQRVDPRRGRADGPGAVAERAALGSGRTEGQDRRRPADGLLLAADWPLSRSIDRGRRTPAEICPQPTRVSLRSLISSRRIRAKRCARNHAILSGVSSEVSKRCEQNCDVPFFFPLEWILRTTKFQRT